MSFEHGVNQLDLFRQPAEPEKVVEIVPDPSTGPVEIVRGPYQLTELPGETFEDIFVPPEAA